MAKTTLLQTSFVGGVLDPQLYGRLDLETYRRAAAELTNVVVMPQGGVRRRPGLKYITTVHDSAPTRLVPFSFNDVDQYLLVFTAGRMDVVKHDTVVASITDGDLAVLTDGVLQTMNWTQSNDVLIVVHPDIQPLEISRSSDSEWTVAPLTITNIPPFAYGGISTATPVGNIIPSAVTGNVTLTRASGSFVAGDVGQFVLVAQGRVLITEVVSSTVAKGIVHTELSGTSPATWQLESGYEPVMSNTRGWPASVTFFQGRLVFGGLKSRPQTLLMSRVGDYFNFDVGHGLDDMAIDVTIDDDRVNTIRHLFPGRDLQVFTSGGEFYVTSADGSVLTPSSVLVRRTSFHGAGFVRPESVDGATLFVEKNRRVIRQFLYSDVEQTYAAEDMTLLSSHIVQNVRRLSLRRSTADEAANFVYVVNGDGSMAVLNTLRTQNLHAWSRFNTEGEVEDLAVLEDVVYLTVKRHINGNDVRFLERFDNQLLFDAARLQTSETATTNWSNLSHLNGKEVELQGDGYHLAAQIVESGSITGDEAVTTLQAGLPFYCTVTTLPLEMGVTGAGKTKRLSGVRLLLKDSSPLLVIAGDTQTQPALRNFGDDVLDAPPQLFSGWLEVPLGGVSRQPQITFTQTQPGAFYILALSMEVSR